MLPIAIFSMKPYTDIPLGNTTFWWIVQTLILALLLKSKEVYFFDENKKNYNFLNWYLVWIILSALRGFFIADDYWTWKALIYNLFGLLVPLVAYTASNIVNVQSIFAFYIKYVVLLIIPFSFVILPDAIGKYLDPLTFLILFIPFFSNKWRVLVVVASIIVIFSDLSGRSNVLRFGISYLLLMIYFLRSFLSTTILELVRKVLIVAPVIFFYLAVTGIFNIFQIQDYIQKDNLVTNVKNEKGEVIQQQLDADTRTFLYVDVLQTARKYNFWLIGRSPARGNESETFGDVMEETTGRRERIGNEVAILNIFTWTGMVGVILYLLMFYRASYLAINKSNNMFCKVLGVFIAFRWVYAWVEDVNNFSLVYFTLWLMIGLCFSDSFRKMNDNEVKIWIRGIFPDYAFYTKQKFSRILFERNSTKL